ncbi:CarboxypepD_reg-like domain-containing protein [Pedobacter steynii]|uniref:CarboxypepD_reg-like domain-containing protein n=1 Tax=Pedobacter steynii TaxID=430522 RepID=A0A1H0F3M3_9SPHI|nr:carboxypeptidase-like regulatory domain-containing protein [Pedobacter steynii]NQX42223.1 carboxypeptidase-like regulatory domain-containing protein [Pedobacter steynii]SDN89205.1 CarboxypepD_reg-like domain-containing protein [Pedobacter steynii]
MNNDWLDIGVLEDYLDGKLDAKTMNRVEREALEDPFVAEALAGLSASPKRSLQSISLLQKQLQERIAGQQESKKTKVITWQRLSIAATAAVMFIAVSIVFWMKETAHQNQLAKQPKSVDVTIVPVVPEPAPPVVTDGLAKLKTDPKKDAAEIENSDVDPRTVEIDRAVRAAKTNTYAANRKAKVAPVPAADAVPQSLNEVVVVGYAAPAQKKSVTYSSTTISAAKETPLGNAALGKLISPLVLTGKVTSASDGLPLSGVSVTVEGTKLAAFTDAEGRFRIPADSNIKGEKVVLNYIGFNAKVIPAQLNEPMNIRLAESTSALAEVVMTANAAQRSKKTADSNRIKAENSGNVLSGKVAGVQITDHKESVSLPDGGWNKWARYIRRKSKFNAAPVLNRQVELSFIVGTDRKATDIKVLNGIDEAYNEEAIRLVLDGPKWKVPANPTNRVILSMVF